MRRASIITAALIQLHYQLNSLQIYRNVPLRTVFVVPAVVAIVPHCASVRRNVVSVAGAL